MSPNYFSTGRRRLQGGRTADEDSPIGGVLRRPEQVGCRAAATDCFPERADASAPDAPARQLAYLPCKVNQAHMSIAIPVTLPAGAGEHSLPGSKALYLAAGASWSCTAKRQPVQQLCVLKGGLCSHAQRAELHGG